jgi:hypothetical protein
MYKMNKLVKRLNYSTWEKRAMFFLQILSNYFGGGGEEKNNILIGDTLSIRKDLLHGPL